MSLYTSAKNDLLNGALNLATADLRVLLIDTADYTYSAAHTTLADVPAAARVGVSAALASKTVIGGAFDAADIVISAVTGDTVEAVIVYVHTGSDTGKLVRYIDKRADGTTAIGLTPNGGDVTVQWSAAGIVVI